MADNKFENDDAFGLENDDVHFEWAPSSPEISYADNPYQRSPEISNNSCILASPNEWTSLVRERCDSRPHSPYQWSTSPEKIETSDHHRDFQQPSTSCGKAKKRQKQQSLTNLGKRLKRLNTYYIEKSTLSYFHSRENKKAKCAMSMLLLKLQQAEDLQKVIEKHITFENV